MKPRHALIGLLMLPLLAQAATVHSLMEQARRQVGDPLPKEARLEGPQAEHFLRLTQGKGPVDIRTSQVQALSADCSRILARVLVHQVPRRDGTRGDFWMDFQISLCRDGHPPAPE